MPRRIHVRTTTAELGGAATAGRRMAAAGLAGGGEGPSEGRVGGGARQSAGHRWEATGDGEKATGVEPKKISAVVWWAAGLLLFEPQSNG